jgi:capsular polysaccharide biosynthesis protein
VAGKIKLDKGQNYGGIKMEQELTLDLREIFEIIRKRIWIIVSITVAVTLISGILSFFVIAPTYEAKTSIIIGKDASADPKTEAVQYNDVMMYQKLVKTYSEIAKSRLVAESTIKKLNLDLTTEALLQSVTITPQADTQIMMLKAESKKPEDAVAIVNNLAQSFIEESQRLYPTGNIQIMDTAAFPKNPIKPKKALNVAIAFFLGLMVSLGIVFLIEYMDNTIKTESDVEKYLDLPVIGLIPRNLEE